MAEKANDDGFLDWTRGIDAGLAEVKGVLKKKADYLDRLAEYDFGGTGEWNHFPSEHPDDGWKFHLNVAPENVRVVSSFLRTRGFDHKYLSGGDVESGKIFTVYTGSKTMTEKSVKAVSDSVGGLLLDMDAKGEAEFAPKIYGRFVGDKNEFTRKGCLDGVTLARERPALNKANVEYAKEKLQRVYGDYFGGGIDYYDPNG